MLINGALDEWEGDIVLRGALIPVSIGQLKVAGYQRGLLSDYKIGKLMEAIRKGRVPDIELSLRGLDFDEVKGVFHLKGDVYIVDGQQRIEAAKRLMRDVPGLLPHVGAIVHFGKDEEWERKHFNIVNLAQTKVSANVTLRNLRSDYQAAKVLYNLAHERGFVLSGKVSFEQKMSKSDLMSAVMFFQTIGMLHGHIGPGRAKGAVQMVEGLQKIMEITGRNTLMGNARRFFEVIDEAWNIQDIEYRSTAQHLRGAFLTALAKLFSEHFDFWDREKLVVDQKFINKLKKFPMNDPTVKTLTSSSGMAIEQLFYMLAEHIDSGKKWDSPYRLKRRTAPSVIAEVDDTEE